MAKNMFRLFGAAALLVSLSACVGPGGHQGRGYGGGYGRGYAQPQSYSAHQPAFRGGWGANRGGFVGDGRGTGFHPGN